MSIHSLSSLYDSIKSETDSDQARPSVAQSYVPPEQANRMISVNRAGFEEDMANKVLLNIYVQAVPLDKGAAQRNMGMMKQDVSSFLSDKNMSATQYFQSAHDRTGAPLLEFIMRAIKTAGREYYESASKKTVRDTDGSKSSGLFNRAGSFRAKASDSADKLDAQITDVEGEIARTKTDIRNAKEKHRNTFSGFTNHHVSFDRTPEIGELEKKLKTLQDRKVDLQSELRKVNKALKADIKGRPTSADLVPQFKESKNEPEGEEVVDDGPPPAPDEADADSALVDIGNDMEYGNFIDKLKRKTVDRIVKDVSGMIKDSKSVQDMTVNFNTESTFEVGMSYIATRIMKENLEFPKDEKKIDEAYTMAVREATLNLIDRVFNQPHSESRDFANRVRTGKGFIITESAVNEYIESLS